jgi:hypothetical protein
MTTHHACRAHACAPIVGIVYERLTPTGFEAVKPCRKACRDSVNNKVETVAIKRSDSGLLSACRQEEDVPGPIGDGVEAMHW